MNITYTDPSRMFRITDVERLDPVTVIVQDHEPGKCTLIVQCFNQAWTAYWGAMGGTLAEFLKRVDDGYVADNLIRGHAGDMTRKAEELQRKYVTKIAAAIRQAAAAGALS